MSAIQLFDLNGEQRFTGTSVGGVQSATVTLTDAQIKALPTTSASAPYGFQIVPDPVNVNTTLIVPTLVTVSLRGTGYTNIGTLAVEVAHAGFHDQALSPVLTDTGIFSGATTDVIFPFIYFTGLDGGGNPILSASGPSIGVGLVLFVDNSLGNFTGGNAANKMTVQTQYVTITVPA